MPETSRRAQVPDFTKVYRVEPKFKETLGIIQADHLYVRQLAESAFIIAARDRNTKTDYVLATARAPSSARTFTHLGRCVQFAVRMSGLKIMHFELLDEPMLEVNDD